MKEEPVGQLETIESSTLPLATIGSQAPLVIDLPDGQKLVIGNLDPGTVIEVATWRGTGRPDSRTNRLMLGVSSADEEAPIENKDEEPRLHQVVREDQVETPQTIKNSMSYKVTSSQKVDEQIKRTPRLEGKFNKKIVIKSLVSFLIVVLILAGLIGPGKLRIAHPLSGVSSSLGSAKNSLIIVRQGTNGKAGEPVIADIVDTDKSPVLAVVAAVDGTNYLLATDDGQFQTRSTQLHGKVYFMIPFLGVLATLFGK